MRYITPVIASLLLATCSTLPASNHAPQSAEMLAGQWQITNIGAQSLQLPEASLQFDTATSAVSASVGCNRILSRYQLHEGVLSFSPAASTLMACVEPEISQLERALIQSLEAASGGSFHVDSGLLTLKDSAGKPVLKARRPDSP